MEEKDIEILMSHNWHRMQDLIKMKIYRNNKSVLQKEYEFRKGINEEMEAPNLKHSDEVKIVNRLREFNASLKNKGVDTTLNSNL